MFQRDLQFYKFCLYGFFKNLKFYEPFFILYLLSKNLSFSLIGVIYAIREITTNILEVPSGVFADIYGRRRSLLLSYWMYMISFALFGLGNNFWIFAIASFLYGSADAFRSGTNKAMIYYYLEQKGWQQYKVAYYGRTRSCSQFGSAISALMAGIIVILTNNLQTIFYWSIVPMLLGFMLVLSYPKDFDQIKGKTKAKKLVKKFWQTLANLKVLKVLFNLSSLEAYYKAMKDYLQVLIKGFVLGVMVKYSVEVTKDQALAIGIGIIYFLVYLLSSYASRSSYKLLSLVKEEIKWVNWLLYIGLIAGILSGSCYLLGYKFCAMIVFLSIFVVHNLRKPISVSQLNKYFDTEIFASAISVQNQFKNILASGIAIGFGLIADLTNFGLALIIISIILLTFNLLPTRIKK